MAGDFQVSDHMLESLRATRPWVKFLAILGFIGCALMVLVALAMLGGVSKMPGAMAGFAPVMGVLYLLFALLYFFPCLYLYRYAGAISRIPESGAAAMEEALAKQKSFWKFVGMVAAIILALELIFIVFGVVLGTLFGMHAHL